MKLVALNPKGYWYSRRNRMDLFLTVSGILWTVLHFSLTDGELPHEHGKLQRVTNREFVDYFGYIVIILRFFTITGKYVSNSLSPRHAFHKLVIIIATRMYAGSSQNADADDWRVHVEKFLPHHRHGSAHADRKSVV